MLTKIEIQSGLKPFFNNGFATPPLMTGLTCFNLQKALAMISPSLF